MQGLQNINKVQQLYLPIIPGQAMSSVSSRSAPGANWLKRSRGSRRASSGEMRSQDSTTLGLCTHTTSSETNSSPSRRPVNSKSHILKTLSQALHWISPGMMKALPGFSSHQLSSSYWLYSAS